MVVSTGLAHIYPWFICCCEAIKGGRPGRFPRGPLLPWWHGIVNELLKGGREREGESVSSAEWQGHAVHRGRRREESVKRGDVLDLEALLYLFVQPLHPLESRAQACLQPHVRDGISPSPVKDYLLLSTPGVTTVLLTPYLRTKLLQVFTCDPAQPAAGDHVIGSPWTGTHSGVVYPRHRT